MYDGLSRPAEQTLLYCCHLFSDGSTDSGVVYLAGGSVQNTVMIWQQSHRGNTDVSAIAVLRGHKGAIFSIDVNKEDGLMVSVGDDRSVMLWRTERTINDNGESVLDLQTWQIVRSMFGHESRVWGGVSLPMVDAVVTWGEDCSVRLWSRSDGDILAWSSPHQGRSIWAGDVSVTGDKVVVATGGNDGALVVTDWSRGNFDRRSLVDDGADCVIDMPLAGDFPRQILFLAGDDDDNGVAMVISDQGYIGSIDTSGYCLSPLTSDIDRSDIKGYCIAMVHRRLPLLLLGNSAGSIFVARVAREPLLRLHTVQRLEVGHKVMVIASGAGDDLFVSMSNRHMVHLEYINDTFQISAISFTLGKSPATCCCSWISPDGHLSLLCGDKTGLLSLFDTDTTINETVLSRSNSKKIGIKSGITAIVRDSVTGMIYVGNKSGEVFSIDERLSVKVVLKNTGLLSWVARLEIGSDGRQLVVLGFKSVLFRKVVVVLQGDEHALSLEHPCGGGHREWDYQSNGAGGSLVFIHSKSVHVARWKGVSPEPSVVKPPLHGKEINCCLLLKSNGTDNKIVIVNGSEDRTLSTLTYHITEDGRVQIEGIKKLHSHISSVRCVVQMRYSSGENVLVSGGGRGQIVLWEVSATDSLRSLSSVFLQKLVSRGSEARIMDLTAVHRFGQDDAPLIAVACSSGTVALMSSSAKDSRLHLELHQAVSRACLTCISSSSSPSSSVLITCSTDGHLYTIPILPLSPLSLGPIYSHFVAKSSLHGLDTIQCDDSTVLVSLGGDDGGVRVFTLIESELTWTVTEEVQHPLAHAGSTVSTVWLGHDTGLLASLGSDEVLILWRVTRTGGLLHLDLVEYVSECVGVTDPHSVAVFRIGGSNEYCFYVAGMGARVIRTSVESR